MIRDKDLSAEHNFFIYTPIRGRNLGINVNTMVIVSDLLWCIKSLLVANFRYAILLAFECMCEGGMDSRRDQMCIAMLVEI